ncbi:hypothetical protein GDO81_004367 [Engystomops pustulosus]|uniref:Uncharacterized protein n=1 Tax=Engystomops pustulosus TaxID=76066 RepID=A0AAV6ZVF1_ENGPU|nr:hypothetical protein GDO81_004367 [Engystomops pustulosus]
MFSSAASVPQLLLHYIVLYSEDYLKCIISWVLTYIGYPLITKMKFSKLSSYAGSMGTNHICGMVGDFVHGFSSTVHILIINCPINVLTIFCITRLLEG